MTVGDRADSYGAYGGNMTHEVKAALHTYGNSKQWLLAVFMARRQRFLC